MNEVLKSIGAALRRAYEATVQKPMPWRMIDTLATLEETGERESKPGNARDVRPAAVNGSGLSAQSKPGVPKPDL